MNIDRNMINGIAGRYRVDADDLFQEVAVRILSGPALRNEGAREAWTYRIAENAALTMIRQRRPADLVDFLDTSVEDRHDGPEEAAIEAERAQILVENVRKLSKLDFDVLNEYYCHGKTTPVIAEELGVPIGTVKRRLHIARKNLSNNLIEKYGPPL